MAARLYLYNFVTTIMDTGGTHYDGQANQQLDVWLASAAADDVDMFTADEAAPVIGEYQLSSAAWEFFGPDGPGEGQPDAVVLTGTGTIADPQTFTPNIPGRWLVRLRACKYILDGVDVVPSSTPDTFTVLYEIQDPNIIGHRDARPYGNGAVTRGASTIAPNESTEYDSDEGWSRGLERYLTTVSREQGFRSTVVVLNQSGVQIDAGKLVNPLTGDPLQKWRNCILGLEDFQNCIIRVETASSANSHTETIPIFLALEDIPDGERGVALVEGVVPFDTTVVVDGVPYVDGATLYVNANGELSQVEPSTLDPAHVDVRVGQVPKSGEVDSSLNPGFIMYHGYTHTLPGIVQGPESSTDNAIATWDGTGGNKLQSTNVTVSDSEFGSTISQETADTFLQIESSAGANGTLLLVTPDSGVDPSGDLTLETGHSTDSATGDITLGTGSSGLATAGMIELEPGASEADGADVNIFGGLSVTGVGGGVTIKGGQTDTGGQLPGNVSIQAGENSDDGSLGEIYLSEASQVVINADDELSKTTPLDNSLGLKAAWLAKDYVGAGADEERVVIQHEYGVNTKFSMHDSLGASSVEFNTDTYSFCLYPLSIGTAAAPGGADLLHVEGSGTFTDLTVINKLNVGGLIDPTGLILTPAPEGDIPVAEGEGAIFVSDGTDGLTAGELYFKSADPLIPTTSLVTGGAPGEVMVGPFAPGTTHVDQVATWQTTDGDTLQGSGIICSTNGRISSVVDPVTNVALSMHIEPNDHSTGGDQDAASLNLLAGAAEGAGNGGTVSIRASNSSGGDPGIVSISSGNTLTSDAEGGVLNVSAGYGCMVAGDETDGGNATIKGGAGGRNGGGVNLWGGSSLYQDGTPGIVEGGKILIKGGVSGREGPKGGQVELQGGLGSDGSAGVYKGGAGGDILLEAGSAGAHSGTDGGDVIIRSGIPNALDHAIWGASTSGDPGKIQLKSADSPIGDPLHPHNKSGANIEILAGSAGDNSGANGGNIVIEPGDADPLTPGTHQGILHMCGEHLGVFPAVVQKSYVAIGSQLVSGIGPAIGMCLGHKAHTIHGHLKVTGIIDPTGFMIDPQTENPAATMLAEAEAAGAVDADGELIDASDVVSQRQIKNTIWFDANAEDRMMMGSEPVGTEGTIKYDSTSVTFDPGVAMPPSVGSPEDPDYHPGGHLHGDLNPEVHYYNVPDTVGLVLVDSEFGDVAIMLPDPTTYPKRSIFVKDKRGMSNIPGKGQILIVPPHGYSLDQYTYDFIDGEDVHEGPYPVQPWASVQCYSDGLNWYII